MFFFKGELEQTLSYMMFQEAKTIHIHNSHLREDFIIHSLGFGRQQHASMGHPSGTTYSLHPPSRLTASLPLTNGGKGRRSGFLIGLKGNFSGGELLNFGRVNVHSMGVKVKQKYCIVVHSSTLQVVSWCLNPFWGCPSPIHLARIAGSRSSFHAKLVTLF